ncbi:hypothetical protein B0H11DRAFT_2287313 [Mycena galericulata]|nr:hypothetical protein B0H11DRAFT_2287313 [Mycena galericulata]
MSLHRRMFSSSSAAFVFAFTVILCIPSILVQAQFPQPQNVGKRDAFLESGLSLASWIWLPVPNILTTAPVGNAAFIKTFATPVGKTAASALIGITVDNTFTLWVNGQPIGGGDNFKTAQLFTAQLNSTDNVFAVLGTNVAAGAPASANPAGLLAAIHILYSDGSSDMIVSDSSWLVSGTVPAEFPLTFGLSTFGAAQVATEYGLGPWGTSVTMTTPNSLDLVGSTWIWATTDASENAPAGTIGFRKTIVTPSDKTAASATVLLSVDNTFELYINGQYIGSPPFDDNADGEVPTWEYAQRFTVVLAPTSNTFTVIAQNFPPQAGQTISEAGVIAAIQVVYTDGTSDVISTDATWLTGPFTSVSSFLATADSTLVPCIVQGMYGMAPWGQLGIADALDNSDSAPLNLPVETSAVHLPSFTLNITSPSATGTTSPPPTGITSPSPSNTSSSPTSITSSSPTSNSARATISARTAPILFFFSVMASVVL